MSKLSFRARALDATKPLPVFRCEDLPDLHEYASINRAVPQMPTGMEKEEESVCFIAARQVLDFWTFSHCEGRPYILSAQACAKWTPCLFSVHTIEHDEFSTYYQCSTVIVIRCLYWFDIWFISCVICSYIAYNCVGKHKGVTWLVSHPPFCWLSLW